MINIRSDPRVMDITLALGAELLVSANLSPDTTAARNALSAALASGKAAEHFNHMVASLGGPVNFLEAHATHLPQAPIFKAVHADKEGFVSTIKTRDLGLAVIELGGGRRVATDKINHAVGLDKLLGKGARVDRSTPLCIIHAQTDSDFEKAAHIVKSAFVIGDNVASGPNIIERIAP
jgi:thymidine phosphorylase